MTENPNLVCSQICQGCLIYPPYTMLCKNDAELWQKGYTAGIADATPKVKELEWYVRDDGEIVYAKSVGLLYRIRYFGGKFMPAIFLCYQVHPDSIGLPTYDTLEAAKAACENHHQTTVLSLLA